MLHGRKEKDREVGLRDREKEGSFEGCFETLNF
jgi:hypothetical protein